MKHEEKEKVEVPLATLQKMQEQMAALEAKVEDGIAKNAGLEELFRAADTTGEPKLREKRSFEPKFHTVRLRKYAIDGDVENMGYVIGWSDRGAYQKLDTSGIHKELVDFIDIFFLDEPKNKEGKRIAHQTRLLDLINNSEQIVCKIIDQKVERKIVETGEEIDVTTWDPQHGLMATGDKIDGFYTYSDIQYQVQIPGHEPIWIDAKFANQ